MTTALAFRGLSQAVRASKAERERSISAVQSPQEQPSVAPAAVSDRDAGTTATEGGAEGSFDQDSSASTVLSELQEQTARLDRQRHQQEEAAIERQRQNYNLVEH